ncbi:MAG: hypothetical protein NTX25_09270 [Proteobacteria bacterium]|nr:hypothetical protein [Pseudomonadota bacterium]
MQRLLKDAENVPSQVRANPFKLRLGLLRGSHDGRQGSHLCMNLLVAHALAPVFTVLPIIGELETTHLRKVWDIKEPVLRATRELMVDWGMQPKGPKFQVEARWSEAVLGSSIHARLPLSTSIGISQLKLQLPDALIQYLQTEAASLKADDWPSVGKIYGAWV